MVIYIVNIRQVDGLLIVQTTLPYLKNYWCLRVYVTILTILRCLCLEEALIIELCLQITELLLPIALECELSRG